MCQLVSSMASPALTEYLLSLVLYFNMTKVTNNANYIHPRNNKTSKGFVIGIKEET